MKKIVVTSITALLASTVAYAGSFDGPYVSVGAGAQYTGNSNFSGTASNDISDTHFVGQVLAGYAFEITPKFNLATNVFFNLSNDKAGSSSSIAATTKNNIGISIEPGYYLDDKTLAYVKVGYARIDSKLDDGTLKTNDSLNGYLFGVGAKYLVDKNIYVGAEFTHYGYGNNTAQLTSPTSYKTEQNVGLITLGYQF
jgi:outer membrane immunogenic protein